MMMMVNWKILEILSTQPVNSFPFMQSSGRWWICMQLPFAWSELRWCRRHSQAKSPQRIDGDFAILPLVPHLLLRKEFKLMLEAFSSLAQRVILFKVGEARKMKCCNDQSVHFSIKILLLQYITTSHGEQSIAAITFHSTDILLFKSPSGELVKRSVFGAQYLRSIWAVHSDHVLILSLVRVSVYFFLSLWSDSPIRLSNGLAAPESPPFIQFNSQDCECWSQHRLTVTCTLSLCPHRQSPNTVLQSAIARVNSWGFCSTAHAIFWQSSLVKSQNKSLKCISKWRPHFFNYYFVITSSV